MKKNTKRSLFFSVMALILCCALLAGTTLAWFTDTASTAVNKIQAGNLDVQLLAEDGTSLEGKTLSWQKAAGHQNEEVLWEPGCTYKLQPITIKNAGNLKLKYKIIISGIDGSAKLNDAIDWSIVNSSSVTSLDADHRLGPDSSDTLTIQGTMRTDAGNEYQGLSIDNIGITVVATQDTGEYDSFNDTYDQNAVYPVAPTLSNTTVSGNITPTEGGTLGNMTDTDAPTAAQISVPAGAVGAETNAVFSMNLTESSPDSVTYEISLTDTATGNSVSLNEPATVTANIGTDLINVKVKHNGTDMIEATTEADGTYQYDRTTGVLKIYTKSFSPFQIDYEFDGVASLNGVAYPSINAAISAAKDGDTVVVLKNYTSSSILINLYPTIRKAITVDLNGKTLTYTGNQKAVQVVGENADLTVKNGYLVSTQENVDAAQVFYSGVKLCFDNVKITSAGPGVCGYHESGKTIEILNSEINSNYFGVYQNGSWGGNTIKILGTTITDTAGAGVYISNSVNNEKQTLVIDDCVISGPSGVEMKHTNAKITNSTLIGTATPTGSGTNNNGTCTAGYALAVTTNGENDHVTGTVEVSGTKFYSGSAEGEPKGYVFVYQVQDGSSVTIDDEVVSDYNTYGADAGSDTVSYTLTDFNALTEIPEGVKNVYLDIGEVSLASGDVTIGNKDICDMWTWDSNTNHVVGDTLEDGRKVYMVRENDTIYSSNKAGITLYISGSVKDNPEGGLNQSNSHAITFSIPDASNVVFTEAFTMNGYFRMNTGWADGRNLGGAFYNRTVKSVLFDHSTFNGIWIQNGGFFADSLTLDGCTFNAYENKVSANDSNPLWFCNIRTCDVTVKNCTFKASRPIKVVEQGVYGANVTITGNKFDMSLTNSANELDKPKNDAIMFSNITDTSTLGNVVVSGNEVTGANALLTFFNPSEITMASGATFQVSNNTLNSAKFSVAWKTTTEYTPDFVN